MLCRNCFEYITCLDTTVHYWSIKSYFWIIKIFNKYFTRKHYWLSLFLYNFLCKPETSFSLQTGYFRAKKIRYQSMHNILIWKYRSETAKLRGKRTHITCLLLQWCYDVLSLLWRHIWFDCMMLWGHLSIMTTDRN